MGFTRESISGPDQPYKREVQFQGENIPLELRRIPRWFCWRYDDKGGTIKRTKVPFASWHPNRPADHTSSDSWSTFADAAAAFCEPSNRFDGIGFAMSADDDYLGIDFDHAIRPDGTFEQFFYDATALIASYCERTPSGEGLRMIVKAKFPEGGRHTSDKLGRDGKGRVEFYDRGRYFTFTGDIVGSIRDIAECQAGFDKYHAAVAPPRQKPKPIRPQAPISLDDAAIIDKIRSGKRGEKFKALYEQGSHPDYDANGGQNESDLALCSEIAFYAGGDPAAVDRIFRSSALYRDKWDERRGDSTYGQQTVSKACQRGQFYDPNYRSGPSAPRKANPGPAAPAAGDGDDGEYVDDGGEVRNVRDDLPRICVTAKEGEVNDAIMAALANDSTLFARGQLLVTVNFDVVSTTIDDKDPMPHVIVPVGQHGLRERLSRVADYYEIRFDKKKEQYYEATIHPPSWSPPQILEKRQWPLIAPLEGVVECPVITANGRIVSDPGYDRRTGLLYRPNCDFPPMIDNPSISDARDAVNRLYDLVSDFPFRETNGDGGAVHRAAWLSSLLTVIGRYAIPGPCPMFTIKANVPGAGKSKLVDISSIISNGCKAGRTYYPDKEEEVEKRLTVIAIEGPAIVLFDNLTNGLDLGGPSLDMALTATTYRGRVLGKSESVSAPMTSVFFATGNNISLKGDTKRRSVPIELLSDEDRPEERKDFKIEGDILDYVKRHRGELHTAALTILHAYSVAGSPKADLTPMDFVEWSNGPRQAVHWATGVDPCGTRREMLAEDPESNMLAMMLRGWREITHHKFGGKEPRPAGMTTSEVCGILSNSNEDTSRRFTDLREALLQWSKDGRYPSPGSIGMKLKGIKDRKIDGYVLRSKFIGPKQYWSVEDVRDRPIGPDDMSDESEAESHPSVVDESDPNWKPY